MAGIHVNKSGAHSTMTSLFFRLIPIGFLCFVLLACGSTSHQLHRSADTSLPDNIGIQGYSAVSYFENDRAEPGSADYSVEFDKRIYYFTSAEQAETFRDDPQKYLPELGEYCPYSLAQGRRVGIDPTNIQHCRWTAAAISQQCRARHPGCPGSARYS